MTRTSAVTSATGKSAAGLPAPGLRLQRKCSCGAASGLSGQCEACAGNGLQRATDRGAPGRTPGVSPGARPGALPAGVRDVLRSRGRPLDGQTRAFMEPRFGHSFEDVRIHADAKSAASAQAVGALAYTAGRDIVFADGRFAPGGSGGRALLAHELAHVVQQTRSSQGMALSEAGAEAEADRASAAVTAAQAATVRGHAPQSILRDDDPKALDKTAQSIIQAAQDTSQSVEKRAIAAVQQIVQAYFPDRAALVTKVTFRDGQSGLETTYKGKGKATTGEIEVGRYFVENTDRAGLARRVIQVQHELDHIDQVRSGMVGPSRSDEREFAAFYREALATELPHTGKVAHSTRVRLIDAALGYYYCLSAELQKDNRSKQQELSTRRKTEEKASGKTAPPEPTTCARSSG